tara:strand:+ start:7095 stop:7253 length:159 start_codon:yes stop_codon:yes gene_type:complete
MEMPNNRASKGRGSGFATASFAFGSGAGIGSTVTSGNSEEGGGVVIWLAVSL